MIATLSETIQKQVAQLKELEQSNQEEQRIAATRAALVKVAPTAKEVGERFALLVQHLSISRMRPIQQQITQAQKELMNLQSSFTTQRFQQPLLEQIGERLRNILKQLDELWKTYANEKISPQIELLKLLQQLPELRRRASQLERLQSELTAYLTKVPQNARELTAFDESLLKVQAQVASQEGLSDTVEAFLRKVAMNTATLADLNTDALHWCQQGNRAKVFLIKIATDQGG